MSKDKSLTDKDIGKNFQKFITTQDYSKSKEIQGVKITELKQFNDESGSFNELLRVNNGLAENFPNFELKQVNYSEMVQGSVKAFHLHFNQEDIWFVPSSDKLLVGLLDVRSGSPTYKISQRIAAGSGKSLLIYIPRGVAHGAANLATSLSRIIYFINRQFDPKKPDEKRLPWDILGKEFWEIQK